VTNREFKKFIEAGAYRDPRYWKFPFIKEDRTLSFDQAMALFVDKTDRSAPSTWDLGNFPAGQADYPVSGVSWYEAAAYAQFAGKSLPTVYHWYSAASMGTESDVLETSNFSGKSPAAVGSHASLGPFGTYDMAGNVKEWCFNSDGKRRYILGEPRLNPDTCIRNPMPGQLSIAPKTTASGWSSTPRLNPFLINCSLTSVSRALITAASSAHPRFGSALASSTASAPSLS